MQGFSLVELLVATFILTFGLLAAAQIVYAAINSVSLARAKGNITIVAQEKLAFLADLYSRNPRAEELADGEHGPDLVQVVNPLTSKVMDRFRVTWQASALSDPRPGKILVAKQVVVVVRPIDAVNRDNYKAFHNKAVVVAGVFSQRHE
jgi:prepilin-type N-terminal cleavage/methylation domain-containing protein